MKSTMRLRVRLRPRSSRDEIVGFGPKDELRVRVTVPPVEGAANGRLIKVLSKHRGLSASQITIVSGHRSREKVLDIHRLTPEAVVHLGIPKAYEDSTYVGT